MRAALYYRVSTEEQIEGYSLDAQARAAQLYCAAHRWEVIAEYRDEGKSARTDDLLKRPAFSEMLQDAETGRFDVIVVHKLDRFARNLRVTLETLDRLERANVAFVSISENMDFSTPIGRVLLATLGGFAQYYSDNLSHETKKGKQERKRQGLYNGLIPFGLKKGADRLPVPDPETYPGLLLAFTTAAEGRSDREVAIVLNENGYRSTGNRGSHPFRKDSIRRILTNRFYLGELPDGNGGWLPGSHVAVLDSELFEAAQQARAMNSRVRHSVPSQASAYSLSGLIVCGYCGGKLHITRSKSGRPRVYCYQGQQAESCGQRSTFLDMYEGQLADYLGTFTIPTDYREQIMEMYRRAQTDQGNVDVRRRQIEARLARIKELYAWGDIDRDAYQRERDGLTKELASFGEAADQSALLKRAAEFLVDLPVAWRVATQEQRSRLARLLFVSVELKDDRVAAVTPQPEFAPFFLLNCQPAEESSKVRKRRDSNPRSQP